MAGKDAQEEEEEIVYVMQQQGGGNSWVFWLIVIAILGLLAYYIYTTIESAKNPFTWFDIAKDTVRMIQWL